MSLTGSTMNSSRAVPDEAIGSVLLVEDDEMVQQLVGHALQRQGYHVVTAENGEQALARVAEAIPDVIVADVAMPGMDGFALLSRLRSDPVGRQIPLIFLTARGGMEDVVTGLELGADDYLLKPFDVRELVARVASKVRRPPVPVEQLGTDLRTGLLSQSRLLYHLAREMRRAGRTGQVGTLAVLAINEIDSVRGRLGARAVDELAKQVADAVRKDAVQLEEIGRDGQGRFLLLLPDTTPQVARERLERLSRRVATSTFLVAGERLRFTPVIGHLDFRAGSNESVLHSRALLALEEAALHLDLQPVEFRPEMVAAARLRRQPQEFRWHRLRDAVRTPAQALATVILGLVLPFVAYVTAEQVGFPLADVIYPVVVVGLVVTAASIWIEGFLALDPPRAPEEPAVDYPAASAIIAAYLPNEAATVVETVESFLRLDYPGPLQVVLAYNTPRPLPIEDHLREIARRDPRFVPLHVPYSTSKAQNINTALAMVTGTFVGIFDADHHPAEDSFRRAWRWLSNGYDVVQGHSVVRNGDASWVARMVAVEFESIYAVSHPGRSRLHGFGIFGGSNGYWRTDLLREIRMHGGMLTEDIDSSLRVVQAGGRIATDPRLISRELAPTTLGALWNQRMRWAQGWFQVSLRHLVRSFRSPRLTLRQKVGLGFLLGWRELYGWVSVQVLPLIAFQIYAKDRDVQWFVPVFVLTTLFTMAVGPAQALFAYRLAAPDVRRHRRWFIHYLLVASLFYTEMKNVIGRIAQLKQVSGERRWKVTPRGATESEAGAA
jgi:DNA-binding response OmpR family regulator